MANLCSKCGQPGEFRKGSRQCKTCVAQSTREYRVAHLKEIQIREAQRREDPKLKLRDQATQKAYREANHDRILEKEQVRRKANRQLYSQRSVISNHLRRLHHMAQLDQIKSVPCADCGKTFAAYSMDFDHRDPSTKLSNINLMVSKAAPWFNILKEIAKCDVVCVCCHRLRTWAVPKAEPKKRQLLIRDLKDVPCMDCGGKFHYCQMDFDHVRGEKTNNVAQINTSEGILSESSKCDVVCANCHRTRTQFSAKSHRRTALAPRTKMKMENRHVA